MPPQDPFAGIAQPAAQADPFASIAVAGKPDYWGTSADEVGAFLASNPNYQYLDKDPKFPNRRPGIYPAGPGSEWRTKADSPNHDIDQFPIDLHSGKHTYEGIKIGLTGATAPLAMEATLPELISGLVGGSAGTMAGQQIAKRAGAGETGQEVAGDVGGVAGGLLTGSVAQAVLSKARGIYSALPDALQKELLGVASPRLKNAVRLWDAIQELGEKPATPSKPLDATGENTPYAGEKPPKPSVPLDATGENKPFAGGMDEWSPTKASRVKRTLSDLSAKPQPVVAQPTPAVEPAPGSAGQLANSVVETPAPVKKPGLLNPEGNAPRQLSAAEESARTARIRALNNAKRSPGQSSGDPLLDRLRGIASDIEQQEKTQAAADAIKAKASAAGPQDDLTDLLMQSLQYVRARKGVAIQ